MERINSNCISLNGLSGKIKQILAGKNPGFILDNLSDLVCLHTPNGFYTYVSPSVKDILGYDPEELVGSDPYKLFHPKDLERIREDSHKKALNKEPDVYIIYRIKKKDGSYTWFETTTKSIVNDKDEVVALQTISRDVSTRVKEQENLFSDKFLLNGIINMAPLGIMALKSMRNDRGEIADFQWIKANYKVIDNLKSRGKKLENSTLLDSYPGIKNSGLFDVFKKVVNSGEPKSIEQYYEHEGLGSWLDIRCSKFGDGVVVILNDIEERKKAEKLLKKSEEELKNYIANAPLAIAMVDTEMNYVSVSNRWLSDYDLDKNIIGENHYEIFKNIPDRWKKIHERCLNGETIKNEEDEFINNEEERIWVRWEVTPIYDKDNKIDGMVMMTENITEKKKVREAIIKAREEAEMASKAKSEFLANMSHEIRTPLNGIIGFTDLLLNSKLEDFQREYLEIVKNSSESLLGIINDILDFSKIEAGRLELEEIPFNLRKNIKQTLHSLSVKAYEKDLELMLDIDHNVPDHFNGDITRIRQILVNLIGNGIKFTDEGYISLKIALKDLQKSTATLHFSISDTGIGIPAEKQKHIFSAFNQADVSTSRRFGGTGLGLAITKQLVELMNGEIWVNSTPNVGSAFQFTIKLKTTEGLSKRQETAFKILKGKKVIVIDDFPANNKLLRKILENWEMEVTTYENPLEATDHIISVNEQGKPYDVILIDNHMPELDGFTMTKRLKQLFPEINERIMVLSSTNLIQDIDNAKNLHLGGYMVKPVLQQDLKNNLISIFKKPEKIRISGFEAYELNKGPENKELKILLAEDNQVNKKLAVKILENFGHSVDTAENGLEVLELLEKNKYDIAFMDIQMPKLDGFETIKEIRKKEETSGAYLPIIAMTAHAMKGDEERCLKAGADGYVSKPIKQPAIKEAISRVVNIFDIKESSEENTSNGNSDIFDERELKNKIGNDKAFIAEILSLFIEETQNDLDRLSDVVKDKNYPEVKILAHKLKGSAANIGAIKFEKAIKKLNNFSGEHTSEIEHLTSHIHSEFDNLKNYLAEQKLIG